MCFSHANGHMSILYVGCRKFMSILKKEKKKSYLMPKFSSYLNLVLRISILIIRSLSFTKLLEKTSLITHDLSSLLQLSIQILNSVNLGHPSFFLFFFFLKKI
jgi:hypothetical protein